MMKYEPLQICHLLYRLRIDGSSDNSDLRGQKKFMWLMVDLEQIYKRYDCELKAAHSVYF